MLTICEDKMCAGCMACVDVCPTGAVSVKAGIEFYSPIIDEEKCINCERCTRVCQQLHPARFNEPIDWFEGWAKDPGERDASSSGGIASAIARAFVASGGTVCSCSFSEGRFGFEMADNPDEIDRFKGSKYVKSNPSGAYILLKKKLKAGRKVLFIGLPCQVSAVRNFVGEKLSNRLYTVDLICHGTPSPQLLEIFLNDHGYSLEELKGIAFRRKPMLQLRNNAIAIDDPGVIDEYLLAFLEGIDYTENCYSCVYARKERVSDLTLGDSWGTELVDEMAHGVSLVLCQTAKGKELLTSSELNLLPVNAVRAIEKNSQLNRPSNLPCERQGFVCDIKSGISFRKSVKRALPKQCRRQELKRIFTRFGMCKNRGIYQMTVFPAGVEKCE